MATCALALPFAWLASKVGVSACAMVSSRSADTECHQRDQGTVVEVGGRRSDTDDESDVHGLPLGGGIWPRPSVGTVSVNTIPTRHVSTTATLAQSWSVARLGSNQGLDLGHRRFHSGPRREAI